MRTNIIHLGCFCLFLLIGCNSTPSKKEQTVDSAPIDKSQQTVVNHSIAIEDVKKFYEIKQLMHNNNYPVAEAELRNLVAKNPEFTGAWANLGIIYSETNRLQDAEKALHKALNTDAPSAAVLARMAYVYKKQGRIDQAIMMYEKSLQIDPNYANAHYNVSILYDLYMQEAEKALAHLTKYLELVGSDKEAEIWVQLLERKTK